jgi:uncharacterized protein (DUF2336 family)
MNTQQSLMDELESAVQSGSREMRIDALRRITDLFLLTHLVERVETHARAELARRLAPVDQAPNEVIQRLARDDEIAVAGPVLTQSPRLTSADLVDIARQKGQGHLLAIAGRDQLEMSVTDVLVDRGSRDVVQTLAGNTRAAFSQSGYATLVKRADGDETLSEKLGRRLDIPLALFRDLLSRATEAVRARLLASVSEDQRDGIRRVLADISSEISKEVPVARNIEDAKRLAGLMKETGRLNEAEIMTFARHMKYEEVIAGIAVLCGVPFDLIDRLMDSDRGDALLVPCKAAGLQWATMRAILELRGTRRRTAEHEIEAASGEFEKLSAATAARVLRFWQVRQTTGSARN